VSEVQRIAPGFEVPAALPRDGDSVGEQEESTAAPDAVPSRQLNITESAPRFRTVIEPPSGWLTLNLAEIEKFIDTPTNVPPWRP
jgi:hypothetical protein